MLRRIIRMHAVRPYGDGTGVLCQSFGLLIGMCYVLSRGLRLLPVIFHPFGVLMAFPSPVGVKNASGILIAKRRTQKETASGSFDSRRWRISNPPKQENHRIHAWFLILQDFSVLR